MCHLCDLLLCWQKEDVGSEDEDVVTGEVEGADISDHEEEKEKEKEKVKKGKRFHKLTFAVCL